MDTVRTRNTNDMFKTLRKLLFFCFVVLDLEISSVCPREDSAVAGDDGYIVYGDELKAKNCQLMLGSSSSKLGSEVQHLHYCSSGLV